MIITALIITYKPNIDVLNKNIESLLSQVDNIVIIDNTNIMSNKLSELIVSDIRIHVYQLHTNMGIAAATNKGIEICKNLKSDFVITSDQDTYYPENYVCTFYKAFNELDCSTIAAFVPLYYDRNTKTFAQCIFFNGRNIYYDLPEEKYFSVFQAIASGMVINMSVLNKVGLMEEDLFIDWVDLEWCWRANMKDFKIMCCKDLLISHCLGDEYKEFHKKKITLRNPLRHYYITRNCIYLALYRKSLPKRLRVLLVSKSLKYIAGYTMLSKQHIKNLVFVLRGFKDGILKHMGRSQYDNNIYRKL